MTAINAAKILILATDGYERSELRVPYDQLKAKGADVKIAPSRRAKSRAGIRRTGATASPSISRPRP
ncbi:putative intracellular proteinase [Agrobacterium tumefaciens]|nr:putative intracellular proteinase [Agrobacterium tumefaciens]